MNVTSRYLIRVLGFPCYLCPWQAVDGHVAVQRRITKRGGGKNDRHTHLQYGPVSLVFFLSFSFRCRRKGRAGGWLGPFLFFW